MFKKKVVNYNYKTNLIKFKKLYNIKSFKVKLLIAIIIGLLYSLATTVFVKNTSLYTGGTSSFFFGVARLTQTILDINNVNGEITKLVYNSLFWGLYLLMNIPLFFLAYKKISKTFAWISIAFLLTNQLSGFCWGLIPNLNLPLFGDTSNVNTYLHDHYGIDTIIFNPNITVTGSNWNDLNNWAYGHDEAVAAAYMTKALSLMFYSLCFSFISALAVCILFILGGSSAGSDFITVYFSVKKHKDVGRIYTFINATFLILGAILGSYITGILAWNDIKANCPNISSNPFTGIQYLISANLIASLLWIVLNGILIDKLFPSSKVVKCEIASKKIKEIDSAIFSIESHSVFPLKRFIEDIKDDKIILLCSYLEFTMIFKKVKDIDQDAMIISYFTQDIDAPIDLYKSNF